MEYIIQSFGNPSLVIIAGLIAAISWNLITWWLGIPSSSSHTLIGGFAGAGIAASGFQAVHSGVIGIIALFIVVAPLIGMVSGNIKMCIRDRYLMAMPPIQKLYAMPPYARTKGYSPSRIKMGIG